MAKKKIQDEHPEQKPDEVEASKVPAKEVESQTKSHPKFDKFKGEK